MNTPTNLEVISTCELVYIPERKIQNPNVDHMYYYRSDDRTYWRINWKDQEGMPAVEIKFMDGYWVEQ